MSLAEFLWTFLAIYLLFFYFMILFRVIGDLFSDPEASGLAKTGWMLFLLFVPILAMLIYVLTRGEAMSARAVAQAKAADSAQQDYIRSVASNDPATQIAQAQTLLASGAITQQEFDTIKAKALA